MQKALVKEGRFEGRNCRVASTYFSELSKQEMAQCILHDYRRVSIPLKNLEMLPPDKPKPINTRVVGPIDFNGPTSGGLTRNMAAAKNAVKAGVVQKAAERSGVIRKCAQCGDEYDEGLRRGRPGKVTECGACASRDVDKYTGVMIYAHKTGGAIEIKQGETLIHEATGYVKRRE